MSRNLIILFDGTGNDFSNKESNLTNIAKIARLALHNEINQFVNYLPGVGTSSFFHKPIKNQFMVMMGKIFGWGVQTKLLQAYEWLMEVYEPDDNIFLFGFSRGAVEARLFAGVLHKVGLLLKGTHQNLPLIADLYFNGSDDECARFKETMCRYSVVPHFLGLFDSVKSLGLLFSKVYPMSANVHPDIPYVYHALAIDEKRINFNYLPIGYPPADPNKQTVEEVWFPGCHCDIGGSAPTDCLSNQVLDWMLTKATNQGLIVDPEHLNKYPYPSIKTAPINESYKGFWKLKPPYHRLIPENSNIHSSICYRPPLPVNLPKNYSIVNA